MIGRTFSEYDNDVHITPIAKGGIAPMDYIDVVVNIGTVEEIYQVLQNLTHWSVIIVQLLMNMLNLRSSHWGNYSYSYT